jgi:uncharacterized Tic20 family protein
MKQCCDTLGHSFKQWWYDVRRNPLLMAWNVSTFISVIVPLIVYWVRRSNEQASGDGENNNGWTWWWSNNNNENNNDNEQGGWWYRFWSGENDRREEEQGSGGLVFVYLWTLVMFVVLVYHGHGHILSRSSNGSFLLALFMFANLSFVALLLTGISIRNMDERAMEEQGFFGMFAGCMVMTYILWTFLCSVFCGILYKPNDKEYDSSSYYRQHSDDANNSNRWWGGRSKEKIQEESSSSWISGLSVMPEKKETTGSGIVVKTEGEEDTSSLAPFECFGSDKKADRRDGTMA